MAQSMKADDICGLGFPLYHIHVYAHVDFWVGRGILHNLGLDDWSDLRHEDTQEISNPRAP